RDNALKAIVSRNQHAAHLAAWIVKLELWAAIALAYPKKPTAIGEPLRRILMDIYPLRVGFRQQSFRLSRGGIDLEDDNLGLRAILHANQRRTTLGPADRGQVRVLANVPVDPDSRLGWQR